VVRAARTLVPGQPVVATLNRRVGDLSDHHAFRLGGVPYLFLTCGRWPHYHQPTDTPDRLNYEKMGRIRDYLVAAVEQLCLTDLPRCGQNQNQEQDTTAFEIELLREAVGEPALRFLAAAVGLERLKTSADLDALAARLQAYFDL
jgi:hypothetical protein